MSKRKRRRYDDKFRASAVVMLQAAGYPDTKGALMRVANEIKVPAMTISRWFKAQQNPPPNELVTEKKEDLADLFESAAFLYIHHATDKEVIDDTSGPQAMTAAAIATDKMRLLRGLPTQIIEILPGLLRAFENAGIDATDFFKRATEQAEQIASERTRSDA